MPNPFALSGIDFLKKQQGLSGRSILAGILDLGVAAVPDLPGLIQSYGLTGDSFVPVTPSDPLGHGTPCSGILIGNGSCSKGQFQGIAPQAKLISVQLPAVQRGEQMIFEGSSDLVAKAIRFFIQQKDAHHDANGQPLPLRLIAISIGKKFEDNGEPYQPPEHNPINLAVQAAWHAGIFVVCAAGNYGPRSGTILSSPANDPLVLTVGATDGSQDTREQSILHKESSRGPTREGHPKPDLLAPGGGLTTTKAPGSILDRKGQLVREFMRLSPQDLLERLTANPRAFFPLFEFTGNSQLASPDLYERAKKLLPAERPIGEHYTTFGATSGACMVAGGGILLLLELANRLTLEISPDQMKSILVRTCDKLKMERDSAQGAGHINFRRAYFELLKLKR